MAGRERPPDVGEDGLGRERALRAAGSRDDAVRAVERAAVLHLDVGPRPIDPVAAVGDAVERRARAAAGDHDAGERRQRPVERPVDRLEPVLRQPEEPLDLGEQPVLVLVGDEASRRIDGGERRPADLDRAAGGDDRAHPATRGAPAGPPGATSRRRSR